MSCIRNIAILLSNRASNNEQIHQQVKTIKDYLFRGRVQVYRPFDIDEMTNALDDILNTKYDLVIVFGGDGTSHLVVQKLAHSSIKFIPVPVGTANDFARELGVNSTNLKKMLEAIRLGSFKKVDLIKVNETYMSTNGGIGLAVNVAQAVNQLREKYKVIKSLVGVMKSRVYSMGIGAMLLTNKLPKLKIKISNEFFEKEIETSMLYISNQAVLAGEFKIAPNTKNNDGQFNLSIFNHPNKLQLIRSVWQVKTGINLMEDALFEDYELKKCVIEALEGEKLSFFGDGEVFEKSEILNIEIQKSALEVIDMSVIKELYNG